MNSHKLRRLDILKSGKYRLFKLDDYEEVGRFMDSAVKWRSIYSSWNNEGCILKF